MNKIIELQEIRANFWKAKYRGNYGVYTIKIETDGKNTVDFSCSCPSDYYPCKHIPIIQKSINERMHHNISNSGNTMFEKTVKEMSLSDLRKFVIRFGLYNNAFQQAVLLEFAPKPEQEKSVKINYSEIIGTALKQINFDADDIYDYQYEGIEIDILDQWLNKAREYISQGVWSEAILIAQACLEEYAEWLREIDVNLDGYISESYLYDPFEILEKAYESGYITADELMTYCSNELENNKYDMFTRDLFDNLKMDIIYDTDPDGYISMQDKLFDGLTDKSSPKAKEVLERKIDFYKQRGDDQTAKRIIEENIQIVDFRQIVVKELIAESKFKDAKKLINEYISNRETNMNFNPYHSFWDECLLEIAEKENNIKEIRKVSYRFIDKNFNLKYYRIFKSTYTDDEWGMEKDRLIKNYQKGYDWFNVSVADIYVEDKQLSHLLAYLKKYLRINVLEHYYIHIAEEFPEETLELFRNAIYDYLKNTGRDRYENCVNYFRCMLKIKGGEEMVKLMIDDFISIYKSRKAMIEIFTQFVRIHL